MSYLALVQEAARACPASAPCPDHDARTRVCAGAENRTRNALNATLTTLNYWRDAVRLPKGAPGLLPATHPARCGRLTAEALHWGGRSGLNKALPHDSLTTTTQLFEETVNCKYSPMRSGPITGDSGASATKLSKGFRTQGIFSVPPCILLLEEPWPELFARLIPPSGIVHSREL